MNAELDGMMKKLFFLTLYFIIVPLCANAQQGAKGVFKFLEIPFSTHAAALGGNTVSTIDDELSLVYHNPALLGKEMDKNMSLDYTYYINDIHIANASYCKTTKRIGTFSAGIHYMDYGNMKETSAENEILGDLSAKDILIGGFYSYDLTSRWRGGVGAKFIYSHYADYTSLGVAVDLGLSYYNPDNEFSVGFVIKNMGGQLKSYDDIYEQIPWDVQLGFTKQLAHAPFKISATFQNMREWDFSSRNAEGKKGNDKFFNNFMKHLLLGVEFTPNKNFYAAIGYNHRRRSELKVGEKAGLTGFSAGTGIWIKSFRVGFAVAQYHVSGLSYHVNISKSFSHQ